MIVWIALAGGIGSWCRFRVDGLVHRWWPASVPLGTLVINVTGSLLLGFLAGWALHSPDPLGIVPLLSLGFCGGYTTFSTASVELAALLRDRRWGPAALWSFTMLVLGLGAAFLGLILGALPGSGV